MQFAINAVDIDSDQNGDIGVIQDNDASIDQGGNTATGGAATATGGAGGTATAAATAATRRPRAATPRPRTRLSS